MHAAGQDLTQAAYANSQTSRSCRTAAGVSGGPSAWPSRRYPMASSRPVDGVGRTGAGKLHPAVPSTCRPGLLFSLNAHTGRRRATQVDRGEKMLTQDRSGCRALAGAAGSADDVQCSRGARLADLSLAVGRPDHTRVLPCGCSHDPQVVARCTVCRSSIGLWKRLREKGRGAPGLAAGTAPAGSATRLARYGRRRRGACVANRLRLPLCFVEAAAAYSVGPGRGSCSRSPLG